MYQIRFGEFASHPAAPILTERLVDEAYGAAEAAGVQLLGTRESEVETIMHTASIAHPLHYPSMYQDLTRCRPTEGCLTVRGTRRLTRPPHRHIQYSQISYSRIA